jgi:protein phosphatase
LSAERARNHPERSTLRRSLGRELIVAIDRIAFPLVSGDVLLVCSDGLYNVLDDDQLRRTVAGQAAAGACEALIMTANARSTSDNLTAALVQVTGNVPENPDVGWRERFARLLGT